MHNFSINKYQVLSSRVQLISYSMKREAIRCKAKQENRFLQSKNVSLEKLAVVLIVHQEFLTKHILSFHPMGNT